MFPLLLLLLLLPCRLYRSTSTSSAASSFEFCCVPLRPASTHSAQQKHHWVSTPLTVVYAGRCASLVQQACQQAACCRPSRGTFHLATDMYTLADAPRCSIHVANAMYCSQTVSSQQNTMHKPTQTPRHNPSTEVTAIKCHCLCVLRVCAWTQLCGWLRAQSPVM
jgi:hypothetical protein